jgi:hypothetical protein
MAAVHLHVPVHWDTLRGIEDIPEISNDSNAQSYASGCARQMSVVQHFKCEFFSRCHDCSSSCCLVTEIGLDDPGFQSVVLCRAGRVDAGRGEEVLAARAVACGGREIGPAVSLEVMSGYSTGE